MSEETQDDQARTHVAPRAETIVGKIKETDHVKKIMAVCAGLVFVVVLVIILHGPNKKHHKDEKPDNKVQETSSGFDLTAYQQQVQEAQRQRAKKAETEAVQRAENPAHSDAGIVRPADGDDEADVSYVKQAWKQPMTWDVPAPQNNQASGSNQATAYQADPNQSRVQMIRRMEQDRAEQNAIHEQRLRDSLAALKQHQAALVRQREIAQ